MIYMDYAAATPVDPTVLAAMQPYFSDHFYNPSANSLAAKQVAEAQHAARGQVAKWLGAKPTEIIFTAGGTDANNLAIQGLMRQFPGAKVIVSAIEHEAVLAPAGLFSSQEVAVDKQGVVDTYELEKLIDDSTVLVSIMYANNEIGTIQPLKDISRLVKAIRGKRRRNGNKLPLYLHTDACQAAGYLDMHVDRLGVDMMTLNGGKIYGPKQSGALYVNSKVRLSPVILGGGQERNLRSGTENVAGNIGFATAFELVQTDKHQESTRLKSLRDIFIRQLQESIPELKVNGPLKNRLPNNAHITIPGSDNERLMMGLEAKGIICTTGSACSVSSQKPSHVLAAIGLSDADARASLRFSFGHSTTEEAVEKVTGTLKNLLG